jgi:hypothetical protein
MITDDSVSVIERHYRTLTARCGRPQPPNGPAAIVAITVYRSSLRYRNGQWEPAGFGTAVAC